jgi:PPM family protein phosphatase
MRVKAEKITRPGGRKYNEDYALYTTHNAYGCFLVADGLGGHQGGALAAKTACDSFVEAFKKEPGASVEWLKSYLNHSALALDDLQNRSVMQDTAKTTMVVLLLGAGSATWAHIGDSRLYYFHAGSIAHQTRDHSLPQRLVDIGEIKPDQIRRHEDRNRLLKVFDGSKNCQFESFGKSAAISKGDAFLLCTDGFWEYVLEPEMVEDLKTATDPADWLSRMEKRLLSRVKPNHDNYTALAVLIN